MIAICRPALEHIENAAREALPFEACGFLIGRGGDSPVILEAATSPNVTRGERRVSFEIDPRLHLRLQRELRDSANDILGIFHSHPGGVSAPSTSDRAQAAYPGWIWLITALDGPDTRTCAFRHVAGMDFEPLRLETVSEPSE